MKKQIILDFGLVKLTTVISFIKKKGRPKLTEHMGSENCKPNLNW